MYNFGSILNGKKLLYRGYTVEKFKVIVSEKMDDCGIELLKEQFEVKDAIGMSREDLLSIIHEYDALIVRSVTDVNAELMDICKAQQSQINILTTCSKQQAADIEHLEKERKIYTWMIALALLVLSSLLICRYGRKN